MRAAVEGALFGGAPDPIKIGRHVILNRLGSGGVGMVYAAYDPELDRRVALKVLRPQGGFGSSSSADARTRLRREAQAMAQLNHPNVITVYEVGEVGDEIYISMELVDGEDLSQWIKRGPHPWREVVARFAEAGRGLAAAHGVGLVHRDFKPSNVLAGADGRVRVLDFGLAKLAEAPPDPQRLEESGSHLRDTTITYAGAVVGTPAYMAPEQHAGETVDARSDQFSYCVALFEALYGKRPFKGKNIDKLGKEKLAGNLQIPEGSAAARVPARLRRELLRGLAVDPDERHPSMDVLVSLIEKDTVARRMRWAGAVVVVASLGIAANLWAGRDDPNQMCAATESRLQGIWDDGQRQRLRAAFDATKLAYASESFGRVQEALDGYAAEWTEARTKVCRATSEEGSTQELLSQQLCLDGRLRDLSQVITLLAEADATIVQNAVEAVQTLPTVGDCATANASDDANVDPEQLAPLELELTRAKTLRAAGKYEEARGVATALREDAALNEAKKVEREAMLIEAQLFDDLGDGRGAERALLDTIKVAEEANDDEVVIQAVLELVFVLGVSQGKPEAGLRWADFADGRIARSGTQEQEARLLNHSGILLKDTGDYEAATLALTAALELRQELGDLAAAASSNNNLGIVQLERQELQAARASFERAIEQTAELKGSTHPDLANSIGNLATVYLELEDWARAEQELERSQQLLEATFGREHPRMAQTLQNLGTVYRRQGRLVDARAAYEEAFAIGKRTMGAEHPMLGFAHVNMGNLASDEGDLEEAVRRFNVGLTLLEPAFGAEHPRIQEIQKVLAETKAELAAQD